MGGKRFIIDGQDFQSRWGRWVNDREDEDGGVLPAGTSRSSLNGAWVHVSPAYRRPSPATLRLLTPQSSVGQRASTAVGTTRARLLSTQRWPHPQLKTSSSEASIDSFQQWLATSSSSNRLLRGGRLEPPTMNAGALVLGPRSTGPITEERPFCSPNATLSRSSSASSVQIALLARGRYAARMGRTHEASFGGYGPFGS